MPRTGYTTHCKIGASHSSVKDPSFLGCYAPATGKQLPTFRITALPHIQCLANQSCLGLKLMHAATKSDKVSVYPCVNETNLRSHGTSDNITCKDTKREGKSGTVNYSESSFDV